MTETVGQQNRTVRGTRTIHGHSAISHSLPLVRRRKLFYRPTDSSLQQPMESTLNALRFRLVSDGVVPRSRTITRTILFLLLALFGSGRVLSQTASLSNPFGGAIFATSSNCSVAASCVWMKLQPNMGTVAVTITGTFSAPLTIEEASDGGFNFTSVGTTSGTLTAQQYSVAGMTDFRVRATAYTSGLANVSLQASSAVTSSSSGNLFGMPSTIASSTCNGGVPGTQTLPGGAQCIFVYRDTRYVTDVSTTLNSSTITCPNSDCGFTSADVGKYAWVVNSSSAAVCPISTISTVNTANSITVAATNDCTSAVTATGQLWWGHKDTTNIANAWTATGCGLLRLPTFSANPPSSNASGAFMLVDGGEFVTTPANTASSECSTPLSAPFSAPRVGGNRQYVFNYVAGLQLGNMSNVHADEYLFWRDGHQRSWVVY